MSFQPPTDPQNQPTYQTPQQPYTQYPQTPYPPPPFQQQPPKRPRRTLLWIILGALLLVGIISYYQTAANTQTSTPPAATQAPATPFPTVALAPTDTPVPTAVPKWTTVQTFKGSGSKKTQTFSIGDNWRIKWTCDPASFGGTAFNVIIEVDNADGSYADLPVNTMCKPGNTSDTSYEAAGGTYLLSITSEGDWSLEIQILK